jgi:hypothetical protein
MCGGFLDKVKFGDYKGKIHILWSEQSTKLVSTCKVLSRQLHLKFYLYTYFNTCFTLKSLLNISAYIAHYTLFMIHRLHSGIFP